MHERSADDVTPRPADPSAVSQRALWGVVLLAAVLRLFHLGAQSLWVDELLTVLVSTPAPGYPISRFLLYNIHGPLHALSVYLVLFISSGDAWLRLPSALAGVAAVPLIYAWLRPRFGARVALWAALLLAVNPLHVRYSQEVRNYAFAVCFVLAGCVQLDRLLAARHGRRVAGMSGWVAAGVLSNFSTTFSFGAQTVAFFRRARISRTSVATWLLVGALAAVMVSPWIYRVTTFVDFGKLATPVMPGELDTGERLRGGTTFRLEAVPYTAFAYSAGFSLGPSLRELHENASLTTVLRRHAGEIAWVGALFGSLLIAGIVFARRRAGGGAVLEVALYALLPLIATLLLNWQNAKAFNVRYVIVGLPAYLAFIAAGVCCLNGWRRWLVGGLLLATCGWSLGNHYFNPRYAREDVRGAVAEIERREGANTCLFAPTVRQVVEHYRTSDAPVYAVFADAPGSASSQLAPLFGECESFWYLRAREWVDDPDGAVLHAIEQRYRAGESFVRPGVVATRYRLRSVGETEVE
jgi:4-amino-4-deoxy-L-arabinose transferase-like glycosyltransferase